MLAVANMQETINFYKNVLGFYPLHQSNAYSVIERDGMSIYLMLASDQSVLGTIRGHTGIYIEVESIENL